MCETVMDWVTPNAVGKGASGRELSVLTSRKWRNGRVLRVLFLEGDGDVQSKVQR